MPEVAAVSSDRQWSANLAERFSERGLECEMPFLASHNIPSIRRGTLVVVLNAGDLSPTRIKSIWDNSFRSRKICHLVVVDATPSFEHERLRWLPAAGGTTDVIVREVEQLLSRLRLEKAATPFLNLGALSDRISTAADAIGALRINSAGEIVEELRSVATELGKYHLRSTPITPAVERDVTVRVLHVLAKLYDILDHRIAQLVVSGAVAVVVSSQGSGAVTAYGLGLAAWFGKDAFIEAIDKLAASRRRRR